MLRLTTPGFTRFVQADRFDVVYGGGEANVSVALSNYGLESYFVTKVPTHEIGQAAVNHLRRFGVKDDFIVRGGRPAGCLFFRDGCKPTCVEGDLRPRENRQLVRWTLGRLIGLMCLMERAGFIGQVSRLRWAKRRNMPSWKHAKRHARPAPRSAATLISDRSCGQPKRPRR